MEMRCSVSPVLMYIRTGSIAIRLQCYSTEIEYVFEEATHL